MNEWHFLTLCLANTMTVLDYALGRYDEDEKFLARPLLGKLQKGDLLIADRHFAAAHFYWYYQPFGLEFITRAHPNLKISRIKRIESYGENDFLGRLTKLEDKLVDLDWKAANDNVDVKLLAEDEELYVLARSKDSRAKERAMRKYKLRKYLSGLAKLHSRCHNRDKLLERIGALKQQAGKSHHCVELTIPPPGSKVTPDNFNYSLNRNLYKKMLLRDGMYLLRTNCTDTEPDLIWQRYVLLTQVEAAFRSLKSDLAVRPVHHQLEHRIEAHTFVAFMAYCLMVTLRQKLRVYAGGLTAQDVLNKLGSIMMIEVRIPTTDGRILEMRRYSQPEPEHQIILDMLHLNLPKQPPPKVYLPASDQLTDTICGGN